VDAGLEFEQPDRGGNVLSKSTRAIQVLADAGATFTVHTYEYDPNADRIGMQAAEALGELPSRVLKTLMAYVDRKPVCVILPSDREVALKKLAAAAAGKSAQMMPPADAERMSGYKVGGISPFGQKRQLPTILEEQALGNDLVFVNAGQRGLQVRLDPQTLARLLDAKLAPISA
jgi:Cys-tRNA(Pro)/Cys-tRNA(Cys) deacylase